MKFDNGTPADQAAKVVLPIDLPENFLSPYRLLSLQGLDLYLLPGDRFGPIAEGVGELREYTYRQQLSGSGASHDLDSRDIHYDHFVLTDPATGELAGSARLQFVPALSSDSPSSKTPLGNESYLEHVYPGIKADLRSRRNHLEIGRVALAPRFQRQPHSLMCLFRGGLQVALSSGYHSIIGLVSYNHFAYSDEVNQLFLSNLMSPPFLEVGQHPPKPRHLVGGIEATETPSPAKTIQALEQIVQKQLDPGFRLPVLLRQYVNLMEARIWNLSLARDFNQITEILVAADLMRIPRQRLNHFLDFEHQPVYQQFSWYRGLGSSASQLVD